MNGWTHEPEGYLRAPSGRYVEIGIFDDIFPPLNRPWSDLPLSAITPDTLREHPELAELEELIERVQPWRFDP